MSGNNPHIVPLVSSNNFIEWHRAFTRRAKDKDVWDLLTEKYKPVLIKPDPRDQKYLVTFFTRFQLDNFVYEEGQKKIKAARALIKSAVSPVIIWFIPDEDDPVGAYKFLQERYKPSDTTGRQILLSQLEDTTLNKFKFSVPTYVDKVFEIRHDLVEVKKVLSDDEVARYLLGGLPNSYSNFKKEYSLIMAGRGTPDGHDLQFLTDTLIKEGSRRESVAKAKKAKGKGQPAR
ncbi:hypothetical protein LTR10_013658 [Elasticomyces elasticus]|uniref:DUF4219 domain-containing protein n=1 Tax=Exophiala sideris TaxID=1016849 RepID=A0ABR0JGT7_9EURO|nr:hypothetical protein LTR10_013658 [Elasticomyces elasticus]KAK5033368.1 hypothetical protein LTS07_003670 [Exophiala sideris]KAK5042136.1 hypothetical protein LTR13_001942 [Exophiala sideris]KAK5063912.1 hypothetical protein LTR69_003678 [Exophiala sideris]KAK5185404.1 hypothetical protein LTR44_002393 [Eurotiomycetes sp. CCFEE 6388]